MSQTCRPFREPEVRCCVHCQGSGKHGAAARVESLAMTCEKLSARPAALTAFTGHQGCVGPHPSLPLPRGLPFSCQNSCPASRGRAGRGARHPGS